MQHARKQTSNLVNKSLLLILIGGGLWLSACSTVTKPVTKTSTKIIQENSNQYVFYFPYEAVWRAAQISLQYPIALNNMDGGILETDMIKAYEGFFPPQVEQKKKTDGMRYKISLTLTKGKVEGRDSVRVTVNKIIEKKRDFFSDADIVPSDGLEERVLFYRIERELVIEEALKKAQAKGQLGN